MSFNIASLLRTHAHERPEQRAVVYPWTRDDRGHIAWTHLSFRALDQLSDEYARGLMVRGLRKGDRVSLLVTPCLELIPLVFAIFKVGALPVLIDPGMGRKRFLSCLARMEPKALVGVAKAQAVRTLFPGAFSSVRLNVTVGRHTGWWGGVTLEELRVRDDRPLEPVSTAADDEAAILFTSGSTGPAKGVVYTHGIFRAQTDFIQRMYGIEAGEIDLACFPLFGLFSVGLGMTVVVPELDPAKPAQADPAKLVDAIVEQGCTQAFGSPAIWKNVAAYCEPRGLRLPTLRRILMAGAPVPARLHRSFRSILAPGAEVHTPYGATESLPVATLGSNEVLSETAEKSASGAGTCVGHPAPEMLIRIIRITDAPIARWEEVEELPTGEIGEICVRGPVVTPRYEDEPEATAAAKIAEGEHTVHRMGDVGYLDAAGRLWFCGRKRHRVELAGQTLFSVPVEAIFDAHPDVFRSALVRTHGEPGIAVQLEKQCQRRPDVIAQELFALGAEHAHTKDIHRIYFNADFPVDVRHNAKIHREQLGAWADAQSPHVPKSREKA